MGSCHCSWAHVFLVICQFRWQKFLPPKSWSLCLYILTVQPLPDHGDDSICKCPGQLLWQVKSFAYYKVNKRISFSPSVALADISSLPRATAPRLGLQGSTTFLDRKPVVCKPLSKIKQQVCAGSRSGCGASWPLHCSSATWLHPLPNLGV